MPFSLKAFFKKIMPDKATEIDAAISDADDITFPNNQPPAAPGQTPVKVEIPKEVLNIVEAMKAENKQLLDALADFKKKEEDRDKLLTEKAANEQKDKIEALIKKAVETGKIPAKNEDLKANYKTLLEKDYEAGLKVLEALPATPDGKNPPAGQQQQQQQQKPDSPVMKAILERNSINQ